jgi:hypothetical protein
MRLKGQMSGEYVMLVSGMLVIFLMVLGFASSETQHNAALAAARMAGAGYAASANASLLSMDYALGENITITLAFDAPVDKRRVNASVLAAINCTLVTSNDTKSCMQSSYANYYAGASSFIPPKNFLVRVLP